MGEFKEEHGKTRVGAFLKNIGNIADPILKAVGNLTGFEALNVISDLIVTDKELSAEQKQEAVSLIQLDRADLINARENNTLIQESQFSSWMDKTIPFIIDLFILMIWGALTMFILAKYFHLVTATNIDMSPILGIYAGVTGLATQIVSYHRGSSAGSKMKDLLKR